ncbi:transcriptional regulator, HxlR family [Chryseobacterium carnipullorum]|uniref:winged helix-turn-helix transcriptional regulator n=1 Tax=Chryseobacterium carnipullorum TaxID=1124835 RepID=UPI000921D979|nr:helix-turn-helix domain-containing protein [Chryseobacterium carnipullorum]SHM02361.1 transcriptional regulator, HxlR family [Chryseobacterium carnipullorum]
MTKIKETSTNFANKKALSDECPEIYASNTIGGQWALAICCYLINGKLRFGELRKKLNNITERMLTLQLRRLEEDRIITRTVYAEVPPRVEYELTEIGYKLKPIILEFEKWGIEHKAIMTQKQEISELKKS